ncbi:MAG: GGDEF domain-containing protein [Acidimicrobiales bacterium]
MNARPATVGTPKATGMHRRRICTRIAAETALAVVGSGAVCFLAYFLLGLPIPSPGVGGEVMVIAPFATPLLIAPFVAMPFARASQRISDLLAEVEQARRELTEEVAERVLVQERLAELARRDPLTGLLNRRGFFELSSERADRELAVMVVDVDDFKRVNDEWGHATGDVVLSAIADILKGSAGRAEVARLGGDEFALLADAAEATDLSSAAERVAAVGVALPGASVLTASCSVGIALLAAGESIDVALAAADAEMYVAKRRRSPNANPSGAPASPRSPYRERPGRPVRSRIDEA